VSRSQCLEPDAVQNLQGLPTLRRSSIFVEIKELLDGHAARFGELQRQRRRGHELAGFDRIDQKKTQGVK
jgi:hypothetical protein